MAPHVGASEYREGALHESNPTWATEQGQHRRQPPASERLFLGPELGVEHFTNDGEEVYSGYVFRLKLEAYATGTVWGRLIYDRSSFNDSDAYETLLAWEHSPGSAIYLGGSTRLIRGTDDQPSPTDGEREWTAFTKASWVFGG